MTDLGTELLNAKFSSRHYVIVCHAYVSMYNLLIVPTAGMGNPARGTARDTIPRQSSSRSGPGNGRGNEFSASWLQ